MLTHCANPEDGAELLSLREQLRDWRFYDHFRTDSEAPARRRQVGTRTPVLAGDGADLAAAIATIQEIGIDGELEAAVADAFPGGSVDVAVSDGYFEVEMLQHGLLRPLKAHGTVRRNAALPVAGGGAAVAATAVADDPERARDQPASRPAGAACRA